MFLNCGYLARDLLPGAGITGPDTWVLEYSSQPYSKLNGMSGIEDFLVYSGFHCTVKRNFQEENKAKNKEITK